MIYLKQKSKKSGKWLIELTGEYSLDPRKIVSYHKHQPIRGECVECNIKINPKDDYCNKCYLEGLGVQQVQDSQSDYQNQIQTTKQAKNIYGW